MSARKKSASLIAAALLVVCTAAASGDGCNGNTPSEVDATTVLKELSPPAEYDSSVVGDTITTVNFSPKDVHDNSFLAHVRWTVDNTNIVRVLGPSTTTANANDQSLCCLTVVGLTEGDAVLTGTLTDNVKSVSGAPLVYHAYVSVGGTPTSLKISPTAATLQIIDAAFTNPGGQTRPTATLRSASGRAVTANMKVTWTILDGDAIKFLNGLSLSGGPITLQADVENNSPIIVGVKQGVAHLQATLLPRAGHTLPALSDVITVTVGGGQVLVTTPSTLSPVMETAETQQFAASVKDVAGNTITPPITWSSSRPSIATIDQTGKLTAASASADGDTVTVLATVPLLGITGKQLITVVRHVSAITFTPNPVSVATNGFRGVIAHLTDASGGAVTRLKTHTVWAFIPATDIATIGAANDTGVVIAGAKVGDAVLRASYNGLDATVPVHVTPPAATSIGLAVATGSTTRQLATPEPLLVGSSIALVATPRDGNSAALAEQITFAASPAGLVTITSTGAQTATISGVAAGAVTVTATSTSDPTVRATASVAVSPAPVGGPARSVVLTSTPGNGITTVGGTIQYVATPKDANGITTSDCALFWATDRSVVAQNNNGLVFGVGVGTTGIRAFCTDKTNVSAAARVTVVDGTYGVTQVNITPTYFYQGASTVARDLQFSAAVVQNASGSTAPVTWSLVQSPDNVATIDQTGKVTIPPATGASFGGGVRVVATAGGQADTAWVSYGNTGSVKAQLVSTGGQYLGGTTMRLTQPSGTALTFGVNNSNIIYGVGIPPGTYTVEVRLQGSQTPQTFTNVVVTAGGTVVLSLAPFP